MILKDYHEDDVVQAIGIATKSCDFFPKPAKIIEEIKAIGTRRMMIGEPDDIIKPTDQDRTEVTELLTDFKKRMKWD